MNKNLYSYQVQLPSGEMVNVKPGNVEELNNAASWWNVQDWYIIYNGKIILTPAGEVADLYHDIEDLKLQMAEVKGSKKRQHIVRYRLLKETVKFLKQVFVACEKRQIGTTAFYALLNSNSIDEI